MIRHSQYFTEDILAMSLVNLIPSINVERIIDLGIGNGALSIAALNRWQSGTVDAVDIDSEICSLYKEKGLPNVYVKQGDVLGLEGTKHLKDNTYDLGLCNPPYCKIKYSNNYDTIFNQANLPGFSRLKHLSADVVFFAQNIRYIKQNGLFAVILPDGLLTRHDYYHFRKTILEKLKIIQIIQFPEKAYQKTEARTHVLIISKSEPTDEPITISLMDESGLIIDTIHKEKEVLYKRMDYSYHKWNDNNEALSANNSVISGFKIRRGNFTYKELRTMDVPYLHSNSFKNQETLMMMGTDYDKYSTKTVAHKGDFVMCRVGKRCVGKVAFIKTGAVLLSDCLYRIQIPKSYQNVLMKELYSPLFSDWVKHNAHGVCSKVVSKCDLEDYLTSVLKSRGEQSNNDDICN